MTAPAQSQFDTFEEDIPKWIRRARATAKPALEPLAMYEWWLTPTAMDSGGQRLWANPGSTHTFINLKDQATYIVDINPSFGSSI